MAVRLSIAVQHHPARPYLLEPLREALRPSQAHVVSDPDPEGPMNPWRCYREALLATPERATHRLVIQDDITICDHFASVVESAAFARPDKLLAFFVGGQSSEHVRAVYDACERGWSWAMLPNRNGIWCPVVCCCWPRDMALDAARWADAMFEREWPEQFGADDAVVGHYLGAHDLNALASVPSLVEHPDNVPSLTGRRPMYGEDRTRLACCPIGPDCDARTIDWTIGPA